MPTEITPATVADVLGIDQGEFSGLLRRGAADRLERLTGDVRSYSAEGAVDAFRESIDEVGRLLEAAAFYEVADLRDKRAGHPE